MWGDGTQAKIFLPKIRPKKIDPKFDPNFAWISGHIPVFAGNAPKHPVIGRVLFSVLFCKSQSPNYDSPTQDTGHGTGHGTRFCSLTRHEVLPINTRHILHAFLHIFLLLHENFDDFLLAVSFVLSLALFHLALLSIVESRLHFLCDCLVLFRAVRNLLSFAITVAHPLRIGQELFLLESAPIYDMTT